MQVGVSLGIVAPAGVAATSLPQMQLGSAPEIVGDDQPGGDIQIRPVQVTSPVDTVVTVQWQRNSVSIPGETGSIYKKSSVDAGADIRALVRCFRAGYAPLFVYSNVISVASADWVFDGAMILGAPGAPVQPVVSASMIEV
jgi:hypothetical protein